MNRLGRSGVLRLFHKIIVLLIRLFSIVGFMAAILAFLFLDFLSRAEVQDHGSDLPRTAIIFTGQYDRLDLGLELLASESLDRLFVSGANRTSGLIKERFPALFEPKTEQVDWIANGRVILAPDAHSTLENALETACWLDAHDDVQEVILITSQRHMARASVALQRAIAPVSVVRVISDPTKKYNKYQVDLKEFSRFAATWVVTFLPRSLWPGNVPTNCADEG